MGARTAEEDAVPVAVVAEVGATRMTVSAGKVAKTFPISAPSASVGGWGTGVAGAAAWTAGMMGATAGSWVTA